MSDILIPMGRDPCHEAMDDTAEFATTHPRPFHAQGCDGQGRYKPTYPAEPDPVNAVMGMHDDADEQMRSADSIGFIYIAVGAICWACFIVWVIAGGPNA